MPGSPGQETLQFSVHPENSLWKEPAEQAHTHRLPALPTGEEPQKEAAWPACSRHVWVLKSQPALPDLWGTRAHTQCQCLNPTTM